MFSIKIGSNFSFTQDSRRYNAISSVALIYICMKYEIDVKIQRKNKNHKQN
jgi:hypothetical protein